MDFFNYLFIYILTSKSSVVKDSHSCVYIYFCLEQRTLPECLHT